MIKYGRMKQPKIEDFNEQFASQRAMEMINYGEKEKTPLDLIREGYKDEDTIETHSSDSYEALKQKYEKYPTSLNGIQLLTLGFAELNNKNKTNKQKEADKVAEKQRNVE